MTSKVFSNTDIIYECNDGDNIEMLVKKDNEMEDNFRIYLYNYEFDVGINIRTDIYQFSSLIDNLLPYLPQMEGLEEDKEKEDLK
jgi:hypothetical protein